MGLDRWEQGAFQNHNEGRSPFRPAPAAQAHICKDDPFDVARSGGQMGQSQI